MLHVQWRQSNDGSSSRYVDLTRIGACFTTEFTRRGQVNPIKMHAMKLHSIPNPLGHRHQAPGYGVNGRWVGYGNHYGANLAMTGPQASHMKGVYDHALCTFLYTHVVLTCT